MGFRVLTLIPLVGALALAPIHKADADAGDFIGGAIVGGILGAAIANDQKTTRRTQTVRPGIPSTQRGAETQNALNYFGFNAGRVDGQVGPGTRAAIERYQASMGYPINGRSFPPYQFDFLMQAYYWANSGGQMQTGLTGQPLLMSYRQKVQTGTLMTAAPQQPVPQAPAAAATTVIVATPAPAEVETAPVVEAATESDPALPNLFAGATPTISLANRCNAVMLQTSTNGYTTLASMSDPDQALTEQFCLARTYAMARGEELMRKIPGLTTDQIATQCRSFTDLMKAQIDAASLKPQADVAVETRNFALGTGIPPADLVATSRVCLAMGYAGNDMRMAVGSAVMLASLGEQAYGELMGHHLREGFGTTQRRDLATEWYVSSIAAIDAGSPPAFMPGQADRVELLRAAVVGTSGQGGGVQSEGQAATTLPTFSISE